MDDSKTQSDANHSQPPAGSPPIPPQGGGASPINEGANPNGGKHKRCRILRNAPKWIEMACALALVGITGTYTYYAGGQLCEMRKATRATQMAAEAAKTSADLASKQMEGVSAAIVEFKQAIPLVSVSGPPADGEVRFSFTNTGHVIAHNVHVEFSATLHSTEHPSTEKPLVSGNETIPQLPPVTANAYVPDLIFSFETSASSAKRITDTYDDFIVVSGRFSYENGFGTTMDRPFCYGYLWGPSQFGREFPRCEEIPSKLKVLREAKKR